MVDSTCHVEFSLLSDVFLLCFACSDYLFKLLLIGDSGVGKSCLLLRFAVGIRFFLLFYFLKSLLPNMLDFGGWTQEPSPRVDAVFLLTSSNFLVTG